MIPLLMIALFWWRTTLPIQSQGTQDDSCANTRYLMSHNVTPAQLLNDGGYLLPNSAQTGHLGSGDIGDVWAFRVNDNRAITLTFSQLPANVPLEFGAYEGMNRVSEMQPVEANKAYSISPPAPGVVTLVVQMTDLAQSDNLSAQTYQVSANFNGDDNVAAGVVPIKDSNGHVVSEAELDTASARQIFHSHNGATVRFDVNSLNRVSFSNGSLTNFSFTGAGQMILNAWAQQIDLTGDNLSIVPGQGSTQQTTFYLENYGSQSISDKTDMTSLSDSNHTEIRNDWSGIRGLWVMSNCVGILLTDGRTFTAVIDPTQAARKLVIAGQSSTSTYPCGTFFIRMDALSASSTSEQHEICLTWGDGTTTGVIAGGTVALDHGVLRTQFVGTRDLAVTGTFINISPLTVPHNDGTYPVIVTLGKDTASQIVVQLDWMNLGAFELTNQARFDFIDEPLRAGHNTERSADNIQSIEALQDVIHLAYRDGTERSLLPADDGYIELIKPNASPLFGGAAFDGKALPNAPGFQGRYSNNLGGECAPVNTALKELNCAPNGMINPANGNFWYSVTDLDAYHPVADLTLTRSYNSANANRDSAFGLGWSSNYLIDYSAAYDPQQLTRPLDLSGNATLYRSALNVIWASDGIVSYTTASGSEHTFVRGSDPHADVYTSVTLPGWTLARTGDNPIAWLRSGWTLHEDDGFVAHFDRSGRLRDFGYPARSNLVHINYDQTSTKGAAGQTVTITDSVASRQIQLQYDANSHIVLSTLRDLTQSQSGDCKAAQNCFEVQYQYQNGLLSQVLYPNGQKAVYSYIQNQLVSIDDPRSPTLPHLGLAYDADGMVKTLYSLHSSETAPTGTSSVYQSLAVAATDTTRTATVTDVNGRSRDYVYALSTGTLNTAGTSYQLLSVSNPLAGNDRLADVPQSYKWEANKLTLQTTTGRNFSIFTFGVTGHISGISGNFPKISVNQIAFQLADDPAAIYLPESVDFQDGTRRSYTYTPSGLLDTYTDENGMGYQFVRDDFGTLTQLRRADKVYWTYTYDPKMPGFVQTITQFNGDPADPGHGVSYQWDAVGRLIAIDDSVLGHYRIEYQVADPDSDYASTITVTDPANAAMISTFDAYNRLIDTLLKTPGSDAERHTSYEYYPQEVDPFQRLAKKTEYNTTDQGDQPQTTRYQYDSLQTLSSPDGLSMVIGGTRTTITDPYGRSSQIVTDALDRVRMVSDDAQNVTRYDYGTQDPDIDTYPSNGITITQTDYFAGQSIATTHYTFNTKWQLVNIGRTEGMANGPSWHNVWKFFNAVSGSDSISRLRLFNSTGSGFGDMAWASDAEANNYVNGRPSNLTIPRAQAGQGVNPNLGVSYDALGRVTSVTQQAAGKAQTVNLAYCNLMNGSYQIIRSSANTATCTNSGDLALTYDAYDRLIQVHDTLGERDFIYTPDIKTGGTSLAVKAGQSTWHLDYNAAGDLTQWIDESNVIHSYDRDNLGRLLAVTVPNEPEASFQFEYNTADLLTKKTDGLGRGTAYTYNEHGQIVREQNLQTVDLTTDTYNLQGLLSSVISPTGNVISYRYDEGGTNPKRIKEIITPTGRSTFDWRDATNELVYTDQGGHATTYKYDSLGMLWQITSPENRVSTLHWDEAGQLTGLTTQENGVTRDLQMTYDPGKDSMTLQEVATDGWQWVFDFNSDNQLDGVTNSAGMPLTFTRDTLGRLLGISTGQEKFQWTLARDSSKVSVTDGYNNVTDYTYDSMYREIEALAQDQKTTYQYINATGDGSLNLFITTPTDQRVYIFSPGNELTSPNIVLYTSGERIEYNYNVEGQLEEIAQQTCLQEPYTEITSDMTTIAEVCADPNQPVARSSVRFSYASSNQPSRRIDQEQNTETFAYDNSSNLINYQNVDGKTFTYTYDGLNRLRRISTPSGTDLLLDYALNQVSGICQAVTSQNLDYPACKDSGGVLQTFAYDALGRVTRVNYPNGAIIPFEYAANGGGLLTRRSSLNLVYDNNGLGLLNKIGDMGITYDALDHVASTSGNGGFKLSYDALGRLQNVTSASGDNLTFAYSADNLSYTISDQRTKASFTVNLSANGLLKSINDASNRGFTVGNFQPNGDGTLQFAVNWDAFGMVYNVNRENNVLRVRYTSTLPIEFVDNLSPSGHLQRETIVSNIPQFFGGSADSTGSGYIIATGYDQNDKPLTFRVNDPDSGHIYYQSNFVYSDCGQMLRETRQYQDNTQVLIDYGYGETQTRTCSGTQKQLQTRTITINTPSTSSSEAFSYHYNNDGTLDSVGAGGKVCVSYSYDAAGRLSSAFVNGKTTEFHYDIYNRLTQAGDHKYSYLDGSSAPFAEVNSTGEMYSLYSQEGVLLFQSDGSTFTPALAGGQGQIRGLRQLDQTADQTNPLWVFDPFGRYLDFKSPQITDEPCDLLHLNNVNLAAQPSNTQLWNSNTDLFLSNGLAYSPETAAYLQPNPAGATVSGNIYDYMQASDSLPIARHNPFNDVEGLDALSAAFALQNRADGYQAAAVNAQFMPIPAGYNTGTFSTSLHEPKRQLQNNLAGIFSLPGWIMNNYNLPSASLNPATGGLELSALNAPGQGTLKQRPVLDMSDLIWSSQPIWYPAEAPSTLTLFRQVVNYNPIPTPGYTDYVASAWEGRTLRLSDMFSQSDAPAAILPSSILQFLPLPFFQFRDSTSISGALDQVEKAVTMSSQDWFHLEYDAAIPSAPSLPSRDSQSWLDRYFSYDIFGLKALLNPTLLSSLADTNPRLFTANP
jgi:YD repeat-containing protein